MSEAAVGSMQGIPQSPTDGGERCRGGRFENAHLQRKGSQMEKPSTGAPESVLENPDSQTPRVVHQFQGDRLQAKQHYP